MSGVVAEVEAALGGAAELIVVDSGRPVSDVVAAIHSAARRDAVVVLILPEVAEIDRRMVLAALKPLAIAVAPSRIGAIDVAPGATSAAVAAAARHLALARSTTGQSLQIG